jgi:hypothetical protein
MKEVLSTAERRNPVRKIALMIQNLFSNSNLLAGIAAFVVSTVTSCKPVTIRFVAGGARSILL